MIVLKIIVAALAWFAGASLLRFVHGVFRAPRYDPRQHRHAFDQPKRTRSPFKVRGSKFKVRCS